ncbi:GNAT family N-acetyltransferase [Ramlibacter terrae]|uniref:GNAT family N-acetyltransferase n=1 Tax=Ramlibacter terrae TaxID=2732511 RepID=A0ABX6P2Z1_9BURK|nr:GNAT family N-acetyltransferase [Ramlibacter terrae]
MRPEDRAEVSPDWLARMEAATTPDPWLHGFTALALDGAPVGQGGFKAPPSGGFVEIAYAIEPECEGQGYATEIAMALAAFALSFPEVQTVRAHTLPGGLASQRVLLKSGFEAVGPVMDPEDGEVLRFERRRP